ncbi:MAG: putative neuraminidase (sialidase) [Bryobacterales bacterium]|nr:putative neuraminidase (sialidase) [Bryobacterales bacterium]
MALLRAADAPMGEFIFDNAPFPACHASTIVELASGDLMAAWFGGTAENRPDVAIWGATQSNGKWSPLIEMAREPNTPCWNPVLFYTKDDRLWFYYKFGTSPSQWSGARQYSTDNGKTWSPVEHLPAGLYGPIRAKPLVMDDGTVVSGTSVESYHSWAVWIERSTDNGKTFRRVGPITVPGLDTIHNRSSSGLIQPSVISMGGKHVRLYARSTSDIGRICVADSKDAGQTWSDARPLDLPNPNSGIDAVALKDGRILVIYNHTKEGRSPLNLAVSKDGEKFTMFRTLEDEPKGEFSYPNVIQARDGDLHLTYTWQRKKIRHVKFPLKDVPR